MLKDNAKVKKSLKVGYQYDWQESFGVIACDADGKVVAVKELFKGSPNASIVDKFNRYYHRKDDHNGKVIPPRPEILERFWDGLKHEMKTARKYSTIARDYTIFRMLELTDLRTHEIIMMDVKE